MPEYRYRCPAGHEVDMVHSIKIDVDVRCPECHAPMHRRPMGGAGVFYSATAMLLGWMNENFERRRRGMPHISKDHVVSINPHPGGNRHRPITKGKANNG